MITGRPDRRLRPEYRTAELPLRSKTRVCLVERSSRDGYLLQNGFDYLANAEAFDFEFRPQNQAVFEHRAGHGFDIVGSNKVAATDGRQSAAAVQEGLGRAGSCTHQDTLVLPGGPHHVDQITNDVLANGDAQ